ncbi:MAG: glycerol-3-phosphate dehydrogenase [Acidiferrobacterales bacterium]|nr:glycerol-3-phosphate dehydrogenase [Acidiferrobacterales bacterium]
MDKANSTGQRQFDLVVIGGGVNGAGIARDAAGRGLSVLLCEQDDLANHTSSSSTKLIHGGLRYLEHYDFKLVRHSLEEREVLLESAPHIIWPLRFVLPHHRALRPRWLIRLGLFIYDHLGKRKLLPASHSINLREHVAGAALKEQFIHGFEYSDCWVQDSRLVVLNAVSAQERGANILTRTRCTGLERGTDWWRIHLTAMKNGRETGDVEQVFARSVVNAAGPWVEEVAGLDVNSQSAHGVRLVKGSHVVVPKLFDHQYVYFFQNADDRIMFAIPYEDKYTLLGTTDVEETGPPEKVSISEEEIAYICENASQYFDLPVKPDTVIHSYAGVRPLFDDAADNASKATRDYVLHLNADGPPIVSVYGGKLTTYRKLAEEVIDLLAQPLKISQGRWTQDSPLPGGDFPATDFDGLVARLLAQYSWCPEELIHYYARNYGTLTDTILAQANRIEDLGAHFGDTLYEVEVAYLYHHEWALSADDILFRRTKVGIENEQKIKPLLDQWFLSQAEILRH